LAVESFAPADADADADAGAPHGVLAATVANCSAIDACPSRLCTSRC
jgi:hypothetical protein